MTPLSTLSAPMYRYTEKELLKENFIFKFFLNFFCNKEMSIKFQTILNGKNFKGTVNLNDM